MKHSGHSDKLDAAERRALPDEAFGLPDRREFPMPDAVHVRSAEAYFRYAPEADKPLLAHRILKKAKEFGVDVESETILGYASKYRA
jgi:hypothetical protein